MRARFADGCLDSVSQSLQTAASLSHLRQRAISQVGILKRAKFLTR
jgi:hypothetical protein